MFSTNLSNMLRAVSSALETPVVFLLIVVLAITVIMVGTLIAEFFTERIRLRAKLPSLADDLKKGEVPIEQLIETSVLLKRQKKALLELTRHKELTDVMRESLAVRLLFEERLHYERITKKL